MNEPGGKIDKEKFEALCRIFATEEEIMSFFMCSKSELNKFCRENYKKSFSDIYNNLRNQGKLIIRQMIFKEAKENANVAMKLGEEFLDLGGKTENGEEKKKEKPKITPLDIVKLKREKDA